MTENTIQTVKIKRIINECDGIKTIIFNVKDSDLMQNNKLPKSGQFVMIWVPGIDEIPMSISGYDEKGNWSITVKNIGECTKQFEILGESMDESIYYQTNAKYYRKITQISFINLYLSISFLVIPNFLSTLSSTAIPFTSKHNGKKTL